MRRVALSATAAIALGLTPAVATAAPADPPGALVAIEDLADGWGGAENPYRITYRTTDAAGEITTATGVVFLPSGAAPDGGWPVVSWDHGTSGLGQQCGLADRGDTSTGPTLRRFTDLGYAAVATDYLGLSPESPGPHPYLQGRSEATATVDIVRAAREAFPQLSSSWAVAGSSQGGHAALNTGHLAPTYAPELDFRGTAALAAPSNLESVFTFVGPDLPKIGPLAGVARSLLAVLAGMNGTQSDVDVTDYLTPEGVEVIEGLAGACSADWNAVIGDRWIGDLLTRSLGEGAMPQALRKYMAVPTRGYQDPILVVHGTSDGTVPLPLALALAAQLTAGGADHTFRTLSAGHTDLREKGGLDLVAAFLGDVMPTEQNPSTGTAPGTGSAGS